MRAMLGLMGAVLALAMAGCGGEGGSCAQKFKGVGGKTYCMPDPSEQKWACIPIDKRSAQECSWVPEECGLGMVMYVSPEDGEYLALCDCRGEGEQCDGKPVDYPG